MPFIYYIVSVESMEILRFLLSFLLKEYGGENFAAVSDALINGGDLKTFLNNLTPENVAPIIKSVFGANKNPSEVSDGLSPVLDIADKDIIDALNGYFCDAPLGM